VVVEKEKRKYEKKKRRLGTWEGAGGWGLERRF